MAKKFVRGITDVKNINNQDYDTNNVNDILSDGEHTYIHRKKKDGTQEYHNLTDNIKTIQKVDNGLLEVTNYNKTKNSATLKVNHDPQKEQKIASTDQTINIVRGNNGTGEYTNLDVNISKVLRPEEHAYDSTANNGRLKTYSKSLGGGLELYVFVAKLDKGSTTAYFNVNQHDRAVFQYFINTYGLEGKINIHGSAFSFNGTTLQFLNNSNTQFNPHVISHIDIFSTISLPNVQNVQAPASTQGETVEKSDNVTVEKTEEIVADKGVVTKGGKLEEIADKLVEKEETE